MNTTRRVLLVERCSSFFDDVKRNLLANGFIVETIEDSDSILAAINDNKFDYVVLCYDGLCKELTPLLTEISRIISNDTHLVVYTNKPSSELHSLTSIIDVVTILKRSKNDIGLVTTLNNIIRNKNITVLQMMGKNFTTNKLFKKFSANGFSTVIESNRNDAMTFMATVSPDVILIEPSTFGYEYTDILSKLDKNETIVVLLDNLNEKQLETAFNNNVDLVLPSSVTLDFILERVQKLLSSGQDNHLQKRKPKAYRLYQNIVTLNELANEMAKSKKLIENSLASKADDGLFSQTECKAEALLTSNTKNLNELKLIRESIKTIAKDFESVFETIKILASKNKQVDSNSILYTGNHGIRLSNQLFNLLSNNGSVQNLQSFGTTECANIIQTIENIIKLYSTDKIKITSDFCDNLKVIRMPQIDFDKSFIALFSSIHNELKQGGTIHISTSQTCSHENNLGKIQIVAKNNNKFKCNESPNSKNCRIRNAFSHVKSANGSLNITKPDDYTRIFSFTLQSNEAKAENSKINETTKHEVAILIADDEPSIRFLTGKLLMRSGYKVIEAENGRIAVDLFKRNKKKISMVLLDVLMPEMNGKEAADQIKEISPKVPILFCSGYSKELLENDYLSKISAEVLPKPYHPDELLEKVSSIIAKTKFK